MNKYLGEKEHCYKFKAKLPTAIAQCLKRERKCSK